MTLVVSISEFRQHIAEYIAKVQAGHKVILRDEKKDMEVVELSRRNSFDPLTYGKALEQAAGVFTAKNHPEWKTKKDVINWLQKERKKSERVF